MNIYKASHTSLADRGLFHYAGVWFFISGVMFLLLGFAAILEPMVASLAITLLLGCLLIVGGIAHGIGAFRSATFGQAVWGIIAGAAYAMTGVYFLTYPSLAIATLTLILAGLFFVEAVVAFFAYLSVRDEEGSAWLLVNALVTLALSMAIWWQWPLVSVRILGTLVGVNLIFDGLSRMIAAAAARRLDALVA